METQGRAEIIAPPRQIPKIDRDTIVQRIIQKVYLNLGITEEQMKSKIRRRAFVEARHTAMFLLKKYTTISLKDIGQIFGGRDHSSVIHAIATVKALRFTEKKYDDLVKRLENRIEEELEYYQQ